MKSLLRTNKLTPLVIGLLFVTAGCAAPQGDTATKPRLALVMKSLANEFFQTMQSGASEYQKAHAEQFDLISNGIKDEQDVARQIDLVEEMIAQNVSAIVIAPADSKSLVSVCKKAQDAGIAVVNIDNKLDDAVLAEKNIKIPFVGPDNRLGARLAGEYLAKKLPPAAKVAIIEGVPNAYNGVQRKLGFEDAMRAAGIAIGRLGDGEGQSSSFRFVGRASRLEGSSLRQRQHGFGGGRRGQSGGQITRHSNRGL